MKVKKQYVEYIGFVLPILLALICLVSCVSCASSIAQTETAETTAEETKEETKQDETRYSVNPYSGVVTCQMAGYTENYAWNEAAKACQPGYIDDFGVFHSLAESSARYYVPNTADTYH